MLSAMGGAERGVLVDLGQGFAIEDVQSKAFITTLGQRLVVQPAADGFVLDGRRMRLLAPGGKVAELTLSETEILTQLALAPERQLDAEFPVAQAQPGVQHGQDT